MTDKCLSAKALGNPALAEQHYSTYYEMVQEDVGYEDLFHPAFWRHHKAKLKPLAIVRVRRSDSAYDVFLTVRTVIAGGVVMEYHGGRPPRGIDPFKVEADARAEAMKMQIAPIGANGKPVIRAEYLPKTKWRVIGLGSEEIKRDLPTREAAEAELAMYLHAINMRNPTDEELLAETKRRADAVAAAQKPAA
jgi:hypothetical protein